MFWSLGALLSRLAGSVYGMCCYVCGGVRGVKGVMGVMGVRGVQAGIGARGARVKFVSRSIGMKVVCSDFRTTLMHFKL